MKFLPRVRAAQGGPRRLSPAGPLSAPRPGLLPRPALPVPSLPRRPPRPGSAAARDKRPRGGSRRGRAAAAGSPRRQGRPPPPPRPQGARTRALVPAAAGGGAVRGASVRPGLRLGAARLGDGASPGGCAAPRRLRALRYGRRPPPPPALL